MASIGKAKAFVVCVMLLEVWSRVSIGMALPSPFRKHTSRYDELVLDGVRDGDRRQLLNSWPYIWSNEFNVMDHGARGDGKSCDTQAFQKAWARACATVGGVVIVPAGKVFLLAPIHFDGPCSTNTILKVDGTILAQPSDSAAWPGKTMNKWWLKFSRLNGLVITGSGVIDGHGASWWSKTCKKAELGTKLCRTPSAVLISRSTNIVVKELTIRNAPQVHLDFQTCSKVLVNTLNAISPGNSPDTDGIQFSNTLKATVEYSTFSTGNDCIHIQSGSSDIEIRNFKCGPGGRGISIGPLGAKGSTGCVSDIRVLNGSVESTAGVVSITTWQGGSGSINNVIFENIQVRNVTNPVVIDQNYHDSSNSKHLTRKAVAISNIKYRNIIGTYNPVNKAVYIACNERVPCTALSMINVNLWPTHGSRTSVNFKGGSYCWYSYGTVDGYSSTVGIKDCMQTTKVMFWKSQLMANKRLCPGTRIV